ncbi:hypothetical protein RJ640_005456 [Escallonia rubra]|uniref:Uncharacterized protein n=1 Tax=Escallonia rubra TaxID=112253 RepID=A0AA88UMV3_9ASTE|nr:hypothetical protein RJ640_005456 [Escallonia rubra]
MNLQKRNFTSAPTQLRMKNHEMKIKTRRRHRHMHHNHQYYRPSLNLIQLGLTLTNTTGTLLDLGTDKTCICQFNFSDFDAVHDASAPNSIELLRQ